MLVVLESVFSSIVDILVLWLDYMFLVCNRNFLYFGKCPIFRGNCPFHKKFLCRLAGE